MWLFFSFEEKSSWVWISVMRISWSLWTHTWDVLVRYCCSWIKQRQSADSLFDTETWRWNFALSNFYLYLFRFLCIFLFTSETLGNFPHDLTSKQITSPSHKVSRSRLNMIMRRAPAARPVAALGSGAGSSGDCVLCWLQCWWASVCQSSRLLQRWAAGFPDYLIACKSSLKLPIHHKSYGECQFQSERGSEREETLRTLMSN